jgi:hypothetical protein
MSFPTYSDLFALTEGALSETLVEQSDSFYDLLTDNDLADVATLEIRLPKPFGRDTRVISGYAGTKDAFRQMIAPFQRDPMNPDADILGYRLLYIDTDSVREFAKTNATVEELKAPLHVTADIPPYVSNEFGWPSPAYMGLSGNGGTIFYKIKLPNTPESTEIVKGVLQHLADKFDTDRAKIDTGVFNASRIAKIPGTVAAKGRHSELAPWRYAQGFFLGSDDRSAS